MQTYLLHSIARLTSPARKLGVSNGLRKSQQLTKAGGDRTNALSEWRKKMLVGSSLETVDSTDPAILLLPLSQQLVSRKLADTEKLIAQGLG